MVGASMDCAMRSHPIQVPVWGYEVCERIFGITFLVELCIRLGATGPRFFLDPKDYVWNNLDFCTVTIDIVFILIRWQGGNVFVYRTLRLFRLVRTLRILRICRFLSGLRLMALAMARSAISLLWAFFLLSILLYVFSVYFMQAILGQDMEPLDPVQQRLLLDGFSSCMGSAITLLQFLCGGADWKPTFDAFSRMNWVNGAVFLLYIFFTVFGTLNILTGIFVDGAMSSARDDHDQAILTHQEGRRKIITKLHEIFSEIASSGQVHLKSVREHLKKPEARAYLESIGIHDVSELHHLFRRLDLDSSMTLSENEFISGLIQMRGNARAFDLLLHIDEQKKQLSALSAQMAQLNTAFQRKVS